MDEMVYNSLCRYFHALELKGYMPWPNVEKLLILIFIRDFISEGYRGVLSLEEYKLIERALNCLYGTTCLIPYPDYLKMGNLYLGQVSELAQRVKTLEDTAVLKLIHDLEAAKDVTDSDIVVVQNDSE